MATRHQHRCAEGILLASLGLAKPADLETYPGSENPSADAAGSLNLRRQRVPGLVLGRSEENEASLGRRRHHGVWGASPAGNSRCSSWAPAPDAWLTTFTRIPWLQPRLTVALELNPYLATGSADGWQPDTMRFALVEFPLAPLIRQALAAIPRTLTGTGAAQTPGFEVVLGGCAACRRSAHGAFRCGDHTLAARRDRTPIPPQLMASEPAAEAGGRWVSRLPGAQSAQCAEKRESGGADWSWPAAPASALASRESEHTAVRIWIVRTAVTAAGESRDHPAQRKEDGRGGGPGRLTGMQNLPDWIARADQPVPLLPAFQSQAMATRVHAFIMSLIDGKRSLDDMAAVMEAQQLMPKEEADERPSAAF